MPSSPRISKLGNDHSINHKVKSRWTALAPPKLRLRMRSPPPSVPLTNITVEEHRGEPREAEKDPSAHVPDESREKEVKDARRIPKSYRRSIQRTFGEDVDLYGILNISPASTAQETRVAFFKRGREVLENNNLENARFQDLSSQTKYEFQAVSMAYEIVTTKAWKSQYDRYGWGEPAPLHHVNQKQRMAQSDGMESRQDHSLRRPASITSRSAKSPHAKSNGLTPILRTASATKEAAKRSTNTITWSNQVEELVFNQDEEERDYKTRAEPKWQDEEQLAIQAYMNGEDLYVSDQAMQGAHELADDMDREMDDDSAGNFVTGLINDFEASLDGLENSFDMFVKFATQNGSGESMESDFDENESEEEAEESDIVSQLTSPSAIAASRNDTPATSATDRSFQVDSAASRGRNHSKSDATQQPEATSPELASEPTFSSSFEDDDQEKEKEEHVRPSMSDVPEPDFEDEEWADDLFAQFMKPPPVVTGDSNGNISRSDNSSAFSTVQSLGEPTKSPKRVADWSRVTGPNIDVEELAEETIFDTTVSLSTIRTAEARARDALSAPAPEPLPQPDSFPSFDEAFDTNHPPGVTSVSGSTAEDLNISYLTDDNRTVSTADMNGFCVGLAKKVGAPCNRSQETKAPEDPNDGLLTSFVGYVQSISSGLGQKMSGLKLDSLGVEDGVQGMLDVLQHEIHPSQRNMERVPSY